jgi:hypothetical protein
MAEQAASDEGADDAQDDVADQTRAVTLTGEPASKDSDQEEDEQSYAVHRCILQARSRVPRILESQTPPGP